MPPMTILPLPSGYMTGPFDLYLALSGSLESAGANLQSGDVLVVSSKYASNAEGRVVGLDGVRVSEEGMRLSKKHAMRPQTAEIILRESEGILGGMAGFVMALSAPFAPSPEEPVSRALAVRGPRTGRGRAALGCLMAPNAGIDISNAGSGNAILYPSAPSETAERLRRSILLNMGVRAGVILADSRLMPARAGTAGVAVGCAGIPAVADRRGRPDLDGNPLKVTFQALADSIATAANHVMGEGAESTPFAVVRGSGAPMTHGRQDRAAGAVPADQCVYVRSLSSGTG